MCSWELNDFITSNSLRLLKRSLLLPIYLNDWSNICLCVRFYPKRWNKSSSIGKYLKRILKRTFEKAWKNNEIKSNFFCFQNLIRHKLSLKLHETKPFRVTNIRFDATLAEIRFQNCFGEEAKIPINFIQRWKIVHEIVRFIRFKISKKICFFLIFCQTTDFRSKTSIDFGFSVVFHRRQRTLHLLWVDWNRINFFIGFLLSSNV